MHCILEFSSELLNALKNVGPPAGLVQKREKRNIIDSQEIQDEIPMVGPNRR